MNLVLFFIIIIALAIIVRIGAIALEFTGLDLKIAQFQALSCFTGTGFTTRESEFVMQPLQRRRIASVLMILGYGGFITLIATFANTIRERTDILHYRLPGLGWDIPARFLPLANLLSLIAIGYILYRVFKKTVFKEKFANAIRSHLVRRDILTPASFHELAVVAGNYGVCSIDMTPETLAGNTTLQDLSLRKANIVVLALQRQEHVTAMPAVETGIREGDKLVCFGKLDEIKKKLLTGKKED